jgi:hypothetical protein
MAIQESAPRGGRFSASGSTIVVNDALTFNALCAPDEDCSTAVGKGSWDNAHTSSLSSRGERPSREPSALVQHTKYTCEN